MMVHEILDHIRLERQRSVQVRGNFTREPVRQLTILTSELGELAKAILDATRRPMRDSPSEEMAHVGCVVEEAVQVAALASMIAEQAQQSYDVQGKRWTMNDHKSRMQRVRSGGVYDDDTK